MFLTCLRPDISIFSGYLDTPQYLILDGIHGFRDPSSKILTEKLCHFPVLMCPDFFGDPIRAEKGNVTRTHPDP